MKALILSGMLLMGICSNAQQYKRFTFGVGTGTLFAGDIKPGALLYLEPAYSVRNNLTVGLKLEGALGTLNPHGLVGIGSYSTNVNYFFSQDELRVFAGVGFGLYTTGNALGCGCGGDPSVKTETTKDKNVAGFYPRIGFTYQHLVASVEYNMMTSTKESVVTTFQGKETTSANYYHTNYLSLKIGLRIGGGEKKPK